MVTHQDRSQPKACDGVVERHPRRSGTTQGMTPDQEAHLASIIKRAAEATDKKYRAGQAEHGGNLWEVPIGALVDNAIDEAIDQLAYLLSIKDHLTGLPRFDKDK